MGIIPGKYRSNWQDGLGPGTLKCGSANPPLMDAEISCHDHLVLPAEILPLAKPVGSELQPGLRDAAALVGFGAACHRATTAPRAQADEALLASCACKTTHLKTDTRRQKLLVWDCGLLCWAFSMFSAMGMEILNNVPA